jgi:DNA-binding LacI/PurR family transcriptional regulator
LATLKDIAKIAGVNVSTVSKALRDASDISEQTKLQIKKIADELGYKYKKSDKPEAYYEHAINNFKTIGIICPEVASNYYTEIINIIAQETRKAGYLCIICFTDFEPENEKHYLKELLNMQVKGIIFISESFEINNILNQYKEHNSTPLVLISPNAVTKDFDCIKIDDEYGIKLSVQHLIEKGHTDIGYIGDELSNPRLEAFLRVMEENKLKINKKWIQVSSERFERCGYETMSNILMSGGSLPTAVLAAYDDIAIGAIRAVNDEGLKVPDDISIIGIDNIRSTVYSNPPLTTVAGPIVEMGKIALKLLFKKINSPKYSVVQNVTLSPELIQRKSVKDMN